MCHLPEACWMPPGGGPEFTRPVSHAHPSSPQTEVSFPQRGVALSVSLALSGIQRDRPRVWDGHANIQKRKDQWTGAHCKSQESPSGRITLNFPSSPFSAPYRLCPKKILPHCLIRHLGGTVSLWYNPRQAWSASMIPYCHLSKRDHYNLGRFFGKYKDIFYVVCFLWLLALAGFYKC